MKNKTGTKVLAVALSGCMLVTATPTEASAAELESATGDLTAAFSEAAVGHESSLTLTVGGDFDGTKEVKISDYLPEQEYVENGLVLWLDGIDNVGEGQHDNASTYWTNLVDGEQITINREGKSDTEGTNTFTDNALQLNKSKVYLPSSVATAVNGDAYTVEFVVDSEGYSGYQSSYSPIMTVDEGADTFSIFVRTAGKTMELKQGSNQVRLRTDFANVLDTTSAIRFQKNQESAWFANGEKKDTFTSGNNAVAENVILGGRLGSDAYTTTASYHAVRVYNRALSDAELQQNAAYDQVRYYDGEVETPDVKINGTALSEEGTTTITAEFEDGVATIPVESMEKGTVSMNFTVDEKSCSADLVTEEVLDQAARKLSDTVTLTEVSSTATQSEIRTLIKEQVEKELQDSYFTLEGGSVSVSGTASPYSVTLTLGEDATTKSVTANIEWAKDTDMDVLKKEMVSVFQGEFSFASEEEVTAEALQQQIGEKVEEDITATVEWNEEKGYYELTLAKGETTLTSPLYVNSEVSISEFTEAFLQNCTTRKSSSTVIDVEDGALTVSSTASMTYENVVLPVFNYGRDYMISVDLKVTGGVNDSRWAALSYGVTANQELGDNNWKFWQMAIRKNATASNGVECATMQSNGSWSVPATASYTEALSADKTYNLKVVVKGKRVYEYINDQLVIRYDAQDQMKYGKVAFTFDRINAEYSNLVVTSEIPADLQTEFPKVANGYDASIYEPETSLQMAPAVVSENDGETVSELVSGTRRPSTVIRTVSENLTVTDDNKEITLAEYMEKADKKALVGFRVEDMETAKAFAAYVEENNLVDIMVISKEPEVLLAACNRMSGVHGMLDCSGYTAGTELIDLVTKTNEANSRIMVLPQELATEENIQYIQARAISVWVITEADQMLDVILNGADGILTRDFESAYDAIESFDGNESVLTRNTIITAHRGYHVSAPENTERSAKLAVEAGADAIECDVLLTKDGEVVINHDDTTGRLMNKNLTVADSTLEELQSLTFTSSTAQEGDKIPTLQELFIAADEADPDDDIIHVIEIKSGDTNIIEPMVKIIKEMNMEDRVVFISFYDYQLDLVRQAMPGVAVGELNSVCSSTDDVATAMKKLSDRMDAYGYFYNCSSGAQNTDILQAARFRGIYVHPWTVNSQSTFETEYFENYHGITTDYANFATNYLNKVTTEKDSYTVHAGDEAGVAIAAQAYTRTGAKMEDVTVTMKQISGTPVTWDAEKGVCCAETPGEAEVLMGATYTLPATGKTYTVYSAPITIQVTAPAVDTILTTEDATYRVTYSDMENGTVEYVKSNNKAATTIVIPETITVDGITYKVTSIGSRAFENNRTITEVTIGDNVEKINCRAFSCCININKVTIGKNIKAIGYKGFYNCVGIRKLSMPATDIKIGQYAFYGCKYLKAINYYENNLNM